jgi:hypothetical protein
MEGSLAAAHASQIRLSSAPQPPQKRDAGGFSVVQWRQTMDELLLQGN